MKTHSTQPSHRRLIVGFSLLLFVVAGVTNWWVWRSAIATYMRQHSVPTQVEKAPVLLSPAVPQSQRLAPPVHESAPLQAIERSAPPISPQQAVLQPQIYGLKVDGQQMRLVPKRVALNAAVSPEQALTEGLINLLSQPKTGAWDSAIPSGTRLLNLNVTSQGIYINLSHEFSQGGGSSTMIYRVAQILYTATSLDPTAKVYLLMEGQPLDENHPFSGEGLLLRYPLTRQQFVQDFSFS
ncbi:MAG: GerMN domain-containing protein [Leptolyngbya sp. BL-A-14]